jgi:hypothetical protein
MTAAQQQRPGLLCRHHGLLLHPSLLLLLVSWGVSCPDGPAPAAAVEQRQHGLLLAALPGCCCCCHQLCWLAWSGLHAAVAAAAAAAVQSC